MANSVSLSAVHLSLAALPFPFFVVVFPLRVSIPRHNRCRNQSLGIVLEIEFEFEVEFEMDIPRQIGVGSSVGMIESVVGNNGMIEMMAKVCRRFGIVVVVDIAFVGMLAFVEDDDLLVRKG